MFLCSKRFRKSDTGGLDEGKMALLRIDDYFHNRIFFQYEKNCFYRDRYAAVISGD